MPTAPRSVSTWSGQPDNNSCQGGNAPGKCVIDASANSEADREKVKHYKEEIRKMNRENDLNPGEHTPSAGDAGLRHAADAYTGGALSNVTAYGFAAIGTAMGSGGGNSFSERLDNIRLYQKAQEEVDQEDHPTASNLGDAAGTLAPGPSIDKLAEAWRAARLARRLRRGERIKKDRRRPGGDPKCAC